MITEARTASRIGKIVVEAISIKSRGGSNNYNQNIQKTVEIKTLDFLLV